MNKIKFLIALFASLFFVINLEGQDQVQIANSHFQNENYESAAPLYKEIANYSSIKPIKTDMLKRHSDSKRCFNLSKEPCNTDFLNQIKKIRANIPYNLTNHPITDPKIAKCKNPPQKSQVVKPVPKVIITPLECQGKGSAPLTDTIQFNIIINFLNQFADAFENQGMEFIDMVFNDRAIIITETNIYTTDKSGKKIKDEKKSKKTREGKKEYLDKLKKAFTNNDTIHVDFHKIQIERSTQNENVYGVNFLQIWQSESNFDESGVGWVFLNIDFYDKDKPTIWVKTWQNFETENDDRYYLDDVIE